MIINVEQAKGCLQLVMVTTSELQSITYHMGLHSVTCHPTQVNAPHFNPSQAG